VNQQKNKIVIAKIRFAMLIHKGGLQGLWGLLGGVN